MTGAGKSDDHSPRPIRACLAAMCACQSPRGVGWLVAVLARPLGNLRQRLLSFRSPAAFGAMFSATSGARLACTTSTPGAAHRALYMLRRRVASLPSMIAAAWPKNGRPPPRPKVASRKTESRLYQPRFPASRPLPAPAVDTIFCLAVRAGGANLRGCTGPGPHGAACME